jgi:two-component system, NarL family, response regulator DevR
VHAPLARPLRVYLLDDHDLVRRGLRDLVTPARDITVVGESSSARTAAEMILRLEADVMVLDLHLQDGTGVHVCRQVRAVAPEIRGLLLTAAGDDEAALASILAGADGYTTKFARSVDLVGAIRAVGAQKMVMDRELVERVTADYRAGIASLGRALTEQDRTILTHVIEGLTDTQIAERLNLDPQSLAPAIAALIEATAGFDVDGDSPSGSQGAGRHRRPML